MCDAGTIGLGMMAVGGVTSAIGAAGQADITRANYQYNAAVGRMNAKLAELRGEEAVELGRMSEQQVARGAKRVKGSQVAAIASSGVALGSDTALDILAGTDVLAAQDIMTVRENTRKAVFAEELAAIEARTGAAFAEAGAAGVSPELAAGTSLINTTGQVAERWYLQSKSKEG
jgi:hypothetical protein